jgi:hypothetical protein
VLQLRLAAIDALGEINKYRGVQFSGDDEDPIEKSDLPRALEASEALAEMADDFLTELLTRYDDTETAAAAAAAPTVVVCCGSTPKPTPKPTATPTPTPTPTPIPIPQDTAFHDNISILHDKQSELLELAAQASVVAPYLRSLHRLPASAKRSKTSPKKTATEPVFTKLADAKSLAESLKKIEIAYLNATKTVFAKKAADQAEDKSHWQLKTEAAYDFLAETTQLKDELDTLTKFANSRPALTGLLSNLAAIGANPKLQPAVVRAINAIFSKPPEKKPVAEGAKKETTTEDKKGGDKKDDATAKDADKAKSKTQ